MARFVISPEVADLLPLMQVVVVTAKGLNNSGTTSSQLASYIDAACTGTLQEYRSHNYANAQAHPRIALYRSTLKTAANVSAKKYPQSNESLIKRLLKEGAKPARSISPVVDFYNAISIAHVVTAGAFDLTELERVQTRDGEPLTLRVARDGDSFVPLDAPEAESAGVDKGEVVYAQGSTVVTRHLAWRQSTQALVTDQSTDVMFMSEVFNDAVAGESTELAKAVATSLREGLHGLFGVEAEVEVLGKSLGKLEVIM
ncbi:unnamed protein product [Discula destructiva]